MLLMVTVGQKSQPMYDREVAASSHVVGSPPGSLTLPPLPVVGPLLPVSVVSAPEVASSASLPFGELAAQAPAEMPTSAPVTMAPARKNRSSMFRTFARDRDWRRARRGPRCRDHRRS